MSAGFEGSEVLALDIGGTKMAACRVDENGRSSARCQVPTPLESDAEDLFDAVTELLNRASEGGVFAGIGVGCSGPCEGRGAKGLVSPLNIPGWRRFPLAERLSARYGVGAFVDNDAKALALAEGWKGAAVGRKDYLSMVVSTGVGGGLVSGGALVHGRTGNGGHIGHVIVVPAGRECGCGARGCLEAEASGSAIAAMTGAPPAEAGDEIRRRSGTLVGRAVGSVANLLDLDLVTVAGSVALGYGETFLEAARAELALTCRLSFSREVEIGFGALAGDGPLIGAGAIGLQGLGRLHGAPR